MTRDARQSIAVIMTCHNRRAKTVDCVQALHVAAAQVADRFALQVYLTDDGSSDGSADAVRAVEPGVRILQGSGQLFWNGGMRLAFGAALADGHDFYLWLNDDTMIEADGLARMMASWDEAGDARTIVVGSTHDGSGTLSYGGNYRPVTWKRLRFERIKPADVAVAAETFNGNCVLIPAAAAARLGNLDQGFVHSIGDLDYGLRATAAGIPIRVMPGYAAVCVNDNARAGSHYDRSLPLRERWRKLTSPKALPPTSWAIFCRRHAGVAWPLFWAQPYAKLVWSSAVARLRPDRARASS